MRILLPTLFALSFASPALAQQAVPTTQAESARDETAVVQIGQPATLANVVFAAIKFGALDMTSDAAIDDFAKIEYCDIYKKYHDNEFDWRRVRVALRKKIEIDKPKYPDTLYLEREEEVGQYDFTAGMLLLAPDSIIHTRALQLYNLGGSQLCGEAHLTVFPGKIVALLDKSLIIDGIELSEDEARAVTTGLQVEPGHNGYKTAYGRYTINFKGAEPTRATGPAELDAKIMDVTLYQDATYLRPFWRGLSSEKSHQQRLGGGELDVIPFKGIDPVTASQRLDAAKPVETAILPVAK